MDSIAYPLAVQNLTDLLLPSGLRPALRGLSHVIVVPTRNIAVTPFALLEPFPDHSPLIEHISLSIAPSLYDIGQETGPWEGWNNSGEEPAVVVGNPRIDGQPDGWFFPALPGAEVEAREVAGRFNVLPLLGAAATKDAVVSRAASASVIYLATHGVSSVTSALDSSFVLLSNTANSGYRWTAREIQSAPLRARIVVLSACQTGLGQPHDAGLIGLARAFQLAGVPRVLVSLWNVDDAATSELMLDFVQLAEKEAPATALQNAIKIMRTKRPNPIYWASFALFGMPI